MKTNHIIIGILVLLVVVIAISVFLTKEDFQTTTSSQNTEVHDFFFDEEYTEKPEVDLKDGNTISILKNSDIFTYSENNYQGDRVIYPRQYPENISDTKMNYTLTEDAKSLRIGNLIHKFDYSYKNFASNMGMTGNPNKTFDFHEQDKKEHQIIVDTGYLVTTYDTAGEEIAHYLSGKHIIETAEVASVFSEHKPTTITFNDDTSLKMESGESKTQSDDYNIKSLYVSIGHIVELYEEENSGGKLSIYRYSESGHDDISGIVRTINILKVEPAVTLFRADNFEGESKQFDNVSFSVNENVIPNLPFSMIIKSGINVTLAQPSSPSSTISPVYNAPPITPLIGAGKYTYDEIKKLLIESEFNLNMVPLNIRLVYTFTDAQVKKYRDPNADVIIDIPSDQISENDLLSFVQQSIEQIVPRTTPTATPTATTIGI